MRKIYDKIDDHYYIYKKQKIENHNNNDYYISFFFHIKNINVVDTSSFPEKKDTSEIKGIFE